MRIDIESDRRELPRWTLWLVAVVCFGPLTLMWLLGVLIMPIWIAMLTALLAEPDRFAHDPDVGTWVVALPIGLVLGGLIGLIGIIRVLTLSRRERPKSHRLYTIGMVAVGLVTVLAFNQTELSEVSDLISVVGLVNLVLPLAGAAWLLAESRRVLFADPGRANVERGIRARRERGDDWRLDA